MENLWFTYVCPLKEDFDNLDEWIKFLGSNSLHLIITTGKSADDVKKNIECQILSCCNSKRSQKELEDIIRNFQLIRQQGYMAQALKWPSAFIKALYRSSPKRVGEFQSLYITAHWEGR